MKKLARYTEKQKVRRRHENDLYVSRMNKAARELYRKMTENFTSFKGWPDSVSLAPASPIGVHWGVIHCRKYRRWGRKR